MLDQLDRIESLMGKCLDATNQCLSYISQIAYQLEQIRQEHVRNHPNSLIQPMQMIRYKICHKRNI